MLAQRLGFPHLQGAGSFVIATLIDTLGTGLFLPFSLLYFNQVVGYACEHRLTREHLPLRAKTKKNSHFRVKIILTFGTTIDSHLRYNEACKIYHQLQHTWPQERKVKGLQESAKIDRPA